MKKQLKTLLLSFILIATTSSAFAQYEGRTKYYSPRFGDNMSISIAAGAQEYFNSFNKMHNKSAVKPVFALSIGKEFTPVWGLRAQLSGMQTKVYYPTADKTLEHHYLGFGVDFMINVTNIFRQYEPGQWFDVMAFAGPGMYVGRFKESNNDLTALINGSAGLGLKFHFSNSFAMNIEGRFSDFASMYPVTQNGQDQMVAVTAGFTYTFGGRIFAPTRDRNAVSQEQYNELLAAAAVLEAQNVALMNRKPQVVDNTVVEEIVVFENVPPAMITFAFNHYNITGAQTVMIYNWAEFLKTNPQTKVSIVGYADKVGPATVNQWISVKRAEAVKNVLVKKYGISAERISTSGKGYADIYNQNDWNRCAIISVSQ